MPHSTRCASHPEPLTYVVKMVGSDVTSEISATSAIEAAATYGRELGLPRRGRVLVYGSDGTSRHFAVRNSEICLREETHPADDVAASGPGSGTSTFFAVVLFTIIPIGALFVEVVAAGQNASLRAATLVD